VFGKRKKRCQKRRGQPLLFPTFLKDGRGKKLSSGEPAREEGVAGSVCRISGAPAWEKKKEDKPLLVLGEGGTKRTNHHLRPSTHKEKGIARARRGGEKKGKVVANPEKGWTMIAFLEEGKEKRGTLGTPFNPRVGKKGEGGPPSSFEPVEHRRRKIKGELSLNLVRGKKKEGGKGERNSNLAIV